MSIELVMSSNHLILCCPLLLLPSIFPSISFFQMNPFFVSGGQSVGSFSISISPSNEYSGVISFRRAWLDVLVVQGTLKSLLQYHSSKASILRCSAFFYSPTLTSIQGEGNGNPLQYSCLENPMDRGAWWAAVHGVEKTWTQLSNFTFTRWRRKWQPTPEFLPGESQGRGILVGCRLWVAQNRTRLK